ncbi:hypothetical protein GCM10010964_07980 [Caldovatus sediminis]|uniref:Uncharacterized protein n=1 Tax=Caldovatus sediminis TaxID=2041189 RepID=A0A8J2Z958_9PROT|nr:hypothetical protein [Caldovatus sediminis]GGG22224.1 hypothetical protein GCM10010964_07980 [Caldovatus sediminis]
MTTARRGPRGVAALRAAASVAAALALSVLPAPPAGPARAQTASPPPAALAKPPPAPPGAAWLPGTLLPGRSTNGLPAVLTPAVPLPPLPAPAAAGMPRGAVSPLLPPDLAEGLRRGTLPFTIAVLRRGTAVEFNGSIVPGAARALEAALRGPGRDARVLHLSGPGGLRAEGIRMAEVVSRHRLDTFVAAQCNSACAMVFLAGQRRTILRGAILGFHRGTPVGLRPDQTEGVPLGAELRNAFRRAGIPRWFLDRVDATPPDMLWIPTAEELLEARYVHRVTTDGAGFSAGLPPARAGIEDMPALFRRVGGPFAAAVVALYPGLLPAAAEEVLAAYNDGAAPEELQELVLRAALPPALALLPHAPDAEALAALGALGIIAQAASVSAPELCPALVAGGRLRVAALAALAGPAAAVRDQALATLPSVLLAASGPARAGPPSPDALATPLGRLRARLDPKLAPPQRPVAARLLHLAAPASAASAPSPRHHCDALAALHAEVALMPAPDAGLLARHLLALGR